MLDVPQIQCRKGKRPIKMNEQKAVEKPFRGRSRVTTEVSRNDGTFTKHAIRNCGWRETNSLALYGYKS